MNFGGVFRISIGKWLLGFSNFNGITTCLQVELLAILHGIISAKDAIIIILKLGLTLSAPDLVRNGSPSYHLYAPLINYIRHHLHLD